MTSKKENRGATASRQEVSDAPKHTITKNPLNDFLLDHKVEKGTSFTHTSLGSPKGCFYIAPNEYDEFIDAYVASYEAGHIPCLTEKHKLMAPILIDLDFRQESLERLYTQEFIHAFLNALVSITSEFIDQKYMTCYLLEKSAPRPTNHDSFKDGIHIVIPDVITSPVIQYAIREEILSRCPESVVPSGVANKASEIYDEAVIEHNNWFMYGSKKPDEHHAWMVTKAYKFHLEDKTVKEIHITNNMKELIKTLSIRYRVSDESKYSEKGVCVLKEKRQQTKSTSQRATVNYDKELRELLALLSDQRASHYPDWIRVGWCLHNINYNTLNLWIEFSKRSYKYKPGECERLWDKMNDEGLNKGSLHRWAKEDSPQAYIDLMIAKDDMSMVTIYEIGANRATLPYHKIKTVFERTFAKVMRPLCYVEDTGSDWFIRTEADLKTAFRNIYHRCFNPKSDMEEDMKFIDKWINDRNIKTFSHFDFIPPPLVCPKNVLNMWKGFTIDQIDCPSSGNIEPFLKHISVLVGHDPKGKDYFLKWLAQLIQQPGKLIGIALIFLSDEGAGKNIFWSLFTKMLGPDYYFETPNPERDLFGRFCNGQKHKLIIDLDETSTKDSFANSELLKNMITSEYFNYEQKNVNPVKLRNFARIVFTTNNMICVKITDNSRRYVIYDMSNELVGNNAYFEGFNSYMTDTSNQKAIIEFLRAIDINGMNWITERPLTETYNALKSLCADLVLKFMLHTWEKHRSEEHIIKIASVFHEEFLIYLQQDLKMKDDSVKVWNRNIFGRKINGLCEQNIGLTKKINIGPKRLKGYEIDLNKLQKHLEKKGLLTDTLYMFID